MAITFYNFQTFRHNLSSEEDSLDEWGQRAIETASRSSYDPRVSSLWMQKPTQNPQNEEAPSLEKKILRKKRAPPQKLVEEMVKSFFCGIKGCTRVYQGRKGLIDHIHMKHPEDRVRIPALLKEGKTFPCPISTCKRGYELPSTFNLHMRTHRDGQHYMILSESYQTPKTKIYACPIELCKKRFATRVQVQTHLREDHQ